MQFRDAPIPFTEKFSNSHPYSTLGRRLLLTSFASGATRTGSSFSQGEAIVSTEPQATSTCRVAKQMAEIRRGWGGNEFKLKWENS